MYSVFIAEDPVATFRPCKTLIFCILVGLVHEGLEPQLDGGIFLAVVGYAHIGYISLVLAQLVGN